MAKKTHEEEQREAHYQRELGKRGHSTGSSANTSGLRDHQAQQSREKHNKEFNSDFVKATKGSSGGCSLLVVAGIVSLILGIAGIGSSLHLLPW